MSHRCCSRSSPHALGSPSVADEAERGFVVRERLHDMRHAPTRGCRACCGAPPRGGARQASRPARAHLRSSGSRRPATARQDRVARAMPSSAPSSTGASPAARDSARTRSHAAIASGCCAPLENHGRVLAHDGLGLAILELREELGGFLQMRQRLLVASESEQHLAQHPQRLCEAVGVACATAQVHRFVIEPAASRPAGPPAGACAQSTSDGKNAGSAACARAPIRLPPRRYSSARPASPSARCALAIR